MNERIHEQFPTGEESGTSEPVAPPTVDADPDVLEPDDLEQKRSSNGISLD